VFLGPFQHRTVPELAEWHWCITLHIGQDSP